MAVSDAKVAEIQAAQENLEAWKDTRDLEIDAQVEFMKSVKAAVSDASETASDSATDIAAAEIASITAVA